MIQCIIFKFRKWHTCSYEWYRLYRSYENCRRPGVAILDMQMRKYPSFLAMRFLKLPFSLPSFFSPLFSFLPPLVSFLPVSLYTVCPLITDAQTGQKNQYTSTFRNFVPNLPVSAILVLPVFSSICNTGITSIF